MLISIDHGNKQVKTIHHAPFTSGLVCSEVRPFGGETLTYQGKYYTLTEQRIPYRRDKTEDERFFVLTLFAIAYELEAASFYGAGPVRVQLAVGLPPAHYGAQQKRFAEYFLNRGTVSFTLHDKQYEVLIDEVSCYPQSYAAAITVFQTLQSSPRALIIDIGGLIRILSGSIIRMSLTAADILWTSTAACIFISTNTTAWCISIAPRLSARTARRQRIRRITHKHLSRLKWRKPCACWGRDA